MDKIQQVSFKAWDKKHQVMRNVLAIYFQALPPYAPYKVQVDEVYLPKKGYMQEAEELNITSVDLLSQAIEEAVLEVIGEDEDGSLGFFFDTLDQNLKVVKKGSLTINAQNRLRAEQRKKLNQLQQKEEACECYSYRDEDGVLTLKQCDKCGEKSK